MRPLTVESEQYPILRIALACWISAAGCTEVAVPPPDPVTSTPSLVEHLPDDTDAHRPAVAGPNGLVSAGHPLASMAGIRVLMQGGTAADAAVAIFATLNLVEPMMSGIGGNGFLTVYDTRTDQVYSLNATGAAPAQLDATELSADDLARGIMAGVTPGLFGGWIAILERFGMMSLGGVLKLAIDYAERGHPLDPYVTRSIERSRTLFELHGGSPVTLLPGGGPPEAGTLVTYPDLARTLRKIVEAEESALANGRSRKESLRAALDRFYRGGYRTPDSTLLPGEWRPVHTE